MFPATAVSTWVDRTLLVSNQGTADLHVTAVDILIPLFLRNPGYDVVEDGCSGESVPPGRSCPLTVRFAPTSSCLCAALLRIGHDASRSPSRVALLGTAHDDRANLRVTRAGLDKRTLKVTVTNSGRSAAGPSRVEILVDGEDYTWLDVGPIAPGAHEDLEMVVHRPCPTARCSGTAVADAGAVVDESDEGDNEASFTL